MQSYRPTKTQVQSEREALEANLALVDLIKAVAERKHSSVGQVALAWLPAQKP